MVWKSHSSEGKTQSPAFREKEQAAVVVAYTFDISQVRGLPGSHVEQARIEFPLTFFHAELLVLFFPFGVILRLPTDRDNRLFAVRRPVCKLRPGVRLLCQFLSQQTPTGAIRVHHNS